jgi:hypothetical protein
MGERLETPPEPALGLADPLGHGADLPPVGAEDHHHPVGIAERVGAKDYPLVMPESHETTEGIGNDPNNGVR